MGYVQEPPQYPKVAEANDFLFAALDPARLAEARVISFNVKLTGTIAEQEAFALTWSEIRGIAARAIASGKAQDAKEARIKVNQAVDEKILFNRAYDKFRIGTANSDDPLMKQGY